MNKPINRDHLEKMSKNGIHFQKTEVGFPVFLKTAKNSKNFIEKI